MFSPQILLVTSCRVVKVCQQRALNSKKFKYTPFGPRFNLLSNRQKDCSEILHIIVSNLNLRGPDIGEGIYLTDEVICACFIY